MDTEVKTVDACHTCTLGDTMDTVRTLEERARQYYLEAAEKMKAQPEVARALKLLGKKRGAHIKTLQEL